MSGKKQQKTFERDNLIVEIVRGRVGKENAIGCAELVKLLNEKGYSTKAHVIHSIMGNIIKEINTEYGFQIQLKVFSTATLLTATATAIPSTPPR